MLMGVLAHQSLHLRIISMASCKLTPNDGFHAGDIQDSVDANVGQRVETCRNQWKMNVLSDGCFVEFMLLGANV